MPAAYATAINTPGPASRPPDGAQHLLLATARARPTDVRPAGTGPRRVSAQTHSPRPRRAQATPSADSLQRHRGPRPSTMTHRAAESATPASWASTLALATATNQRPPRLLPTNQLLVSNKTPRPQTNSARPESSQPTSVRPSPPVPPPANQQLLPKMFPPCPGSLG
ncbi:hypothetical protein NN561_018526 [Cricetulus griseus]